MNQYERVFGTLSKQNVNYIIVGGVAMNLLGHARFTNDIDILLALDQENLTKMSEAMNVLGYQQKLPVTLDQLGDEKEILKLMEEKNLLAYSFYNDEFPQFSIDVIVGDSLKFDSYKENVVTLDMDDVQLPVVCIDDLIFMKKEANREKDISDIEFLLELKGL